jgi:hypothetical protein
MSTEIMRQIIEMIESRAHSRPSLSEFEMAYQARVAIDRIRAAITHMEKINGGSHEFQEIGLQLLEALDRLQSADRRFQAHSRSSKATENGGHP